MPLPPDPASYRLMKRIVFPCVFTLVILTTGCGGPKYVPDITLTTTGPILNSLAEFHNLYPATPYCGNFPLHSVLLHASGPQYTYEQISDDHGIDTQRQKLQSGHLV
jgi:hypothetical protein